MVVCKGGCNGAFTASQRESIGITSSTTVNEESAAQVAFGVRGGSSVGCLASSGTTPSLNLCTLSKLAGLSRSPLPSPAWTPHPLLVTWLSTKLQLRKHSSCRSR